MRAKHKLVIFSGLPGVGKSTACKIFLEIVDEAYFFDADEFAKKSGLFTNIDFSKINDNQWNDLRSNFYLQKADKLKKLLSTHKIVVMDALFDKKALRKIIYQAMREVNSDLLVIETVCPEPTVKARIMKDTTHKLANPQKRWEIYQKTKKSWEEMSITEKSNIIYEKISSEINLKTQIKKIVKKHKLTQNLAKS